MILSVLLCVHLIHSGFFIEMILYVLQMDLKSSLASRMKVNKHFKSVIEETIANVKL